MQELNLGEWGGGGALQRSALLQFTQNTSHTAPYGATQWSLLSQESHFLSSLKRACLHPHACSLPPKMQPSSPHPLLPRKTLTYLDSKAAILGSPHCVSGLEMLWKCCHLSRKAVINPCSRRRNCFSERLTVKPL